jgi:hypothetical protein
MSGRFVKVLVPPSVEAPRGARWASELAVWIARSLRRAGFGSRSSPTARDAAKSTRRAAATS